MNMWFLNQKLGVWSEFHPVGMNRSVENAEIGNDFSHSVRNASLGRKHIHIIISSHPVGMRPQAPHGCIPDGMQGI